MSRSSIAEQDRNRWLRGEELYEKGAFERVSATVFIVENPKGGEYLVKLDPYQCSCEDYRRHSHIKGFRCKHLIAAQKYAEWLRDSAEIIAHSLVVS